MKQGIVLSAALLAAVAIGCKGEGDKAKGGAPASTPGTGSAVATATTADAAPALPPAPDGAPATPGGPPAKIAGDGETPRGCVGWSSKLHAAACVTGTMTNGDPDLQVAFVGSTTTAIPVAATLSADDAATINAVLAADGYVAPAGAATPLAPGKPLTLAGATLTLTSKVTAKGGDNVAPTRAVKLTATCAGKDVELYAEEREGITPAATVRAFDDRLLIEVTIAIALEGEQGAAHGVAVLDPATCDVDQENL